MALLLPHSQFIARAALFQITLPTSAHLGVKRLENPRDPIKVISERTTSSWQTNQLNRSVCYRTPSPGACSMNSSLETLALAPRKDG